MLSDHPSGPRSEDENGVVGGSHQRNQVRQLQFDMYPCVDLKLFIRGKFYLSKWKNFRAMADFPPRLEREPAFRDPPRISGGACSRRLFSRFRWQRRRPLSLGNGIVITASLHPKIVCEARQVVFLSVMQKYYCLDISSILTTACAGVPEMQRARYHAYQVTFVCRKYFNLGVHTKWGFSHVYIRVTCIPRKAWSS